MTLFDQIGFYYFVSSVIVSSYLSHQTKSKNARKIIPRDKVKSNEINRINNRFDVIIVGAGPAGSTAAYYCSKYNLKVALFDKKIFPRHKPCGDAWCKPALDILSDMGILQKMEADGIVKSVRRGGLISPFGYKCVNTEGDSYGSVTGCKTYAIKRFIADQYLVQAASSESNCTYYEGTEILDAKFIDENEDIGHWKVFSKTSKNGSEVLNENFGTMLFICDGSTSYLAQKLGIIEKGSQAEAVCSHAYVSGDSHQWKEADGVMVFNKSTLPGYSALFRHYNDDMYLGTYILPGGRATSRCIAPFESEAIEKHPYIREAFGDNYKWAEKRVVAPIRLGGVKKAYGRQLLLIGDAAGHVDPLTGEGIHTAMIAAKIAAQW